MPFTPGPYSGKSTLALVARVSAVGIGVVYGSVKLGILKVTSPPIPSDPLPCSVYVTATRSIDSILLLVPVLLRLLVGAFGPPRIGLDRFDWVGLDWMNLRLAKGLALPSGMGLGMPLVCFLILLLVWSVSWAVLFVEPEIYQGFGFRDALENVCRRSILMSP